MIPLNLPSGLIQVVEEGDLAEAGRHGWRLVTILFEEKIEPAFDTEQERNAPPNGVYPNLVVVTRHLLVKRPRYVMHREVSVADMIEALEKELKKKLEKELEKELKKRLEKELEKANETIETLRKELTVVQQRTITLQEAATILEDDNNRLTRENAQLRAEKARTSGLLEDAQRNAADWLLVVKSIGADRVSQIVGHEVIDPAPLSSDQVPTTFDRLLQEEE